MRRPDWRAALPVATATTLAATRRGGVRRHRGDARAVGEDERASGRPAKAERERRQCDGNVHRDVAARGSRRKLSWKITYSKLDHPRIVGRGHPLREAGQFGPVIVRLCGPCKARQQQGVVKVTSSLGAGDQGRQTRSSR